MRKSFFMTHPIWLKRSSIELRNCNCLKSPFYALDIYAHDLVLIRDIRNSIMVFYSKRGGNRYCCNQRTIAIDIIGGCRNTKTICPLKNVVEFRFESEAISFLLARQILWRQCRWTCHNACWCAEAGNCFDES